MAVGDFTAGSAVSAEVDSMVLPAGFMVDALAAGVTLGEGSDITDFTVIPFTGTATLTTTTDAIIRLGLTAQRHMPCKTVQPVRARSICFRQRHLVSGAN